jgi:uncharacterized protein (TIGR02246 family)
MNHSLLARALVLTAALFLIPALAACDSVSPSEATPAQIASAPADARADLNPVQTRAIEAILVSWEAAWAAKDVSAMVAHYTEDVDWVNPLGGILSGREEIRAVHEFLFGGPFAGSTQTATVRRIEALTGNIMVVDLDVTLTGYQSLLPGLVAFEPGVVRVRVKWIVVREGSAWRVSAQHMTAVQPLPPPAP